jgi:hypothetical protein
MPREGLYFTAQSVARALVKLIREDMAKAQKSRDAAFDLFMRGSKAKRINLLLKSMGRNTENANFRLNNLDKMLSEFTLSRKG